MAKRFFYVCAGVFLLALSYHLGARSATAQGSQLFRVLSSSPLMIESGGQVYLLSAESGWRIPSDLPPVPVSSRLAGDPGTYVTTDGSAWRKNGYTGAWDAFPFPGAPTPAQQSTWGGVKARYR